MDVKDCIKYIQESEYTRDDAIRYVQSQDLTNDERNLVISYCFPRPLRDRELPERVSNFRRALNRPAGGTKEICQGEVNLIIEAGKTIQYGRFIKHLMHAFDQPEKINPIDGEGSCECCICGKNLYEAKMWKTLVNENRAMAEAENKEYLAYGSEDSQVSLCLDCIAQLTEAREKIKDIEPGFLDWTKRYE